MLSSMRTLKRLAATALVAVMMALPILAVPTNSAQPKSAAETMKKIRQRLVTLPYYGVFDNLAYTYEEGVVTLYGQVVRPTTRSDAAHSVVRIPGVDQVINRIEVLPLSSFDDRIRIAAYRAIYRQPGLNRLALQAVPPIHIIVNRGHITLEGVVPTQSDAHLAYIAARGVPNAFSVTDHLRVEK
jgi:hyperosmotically inducible protein